MKSRLISLCTLLLTVLCCPGRSDAAVTIGITGGSGSPITITLLQPIEYTVTTDLSFYPVFTFDGAGNLFPGASAVASGSMTYSINGGPSQPINYISSGYSGGDTTPDDLSFLYSSALYGLQAGDTVVLNAGTFTTTGSPAAATPGVISIETFLINDFGGRISTFGITVPEPGAALLLGLGCTGMVLRRRRGMK
jgi:hypothetical protein